MAVQTLRLGLEDLADSVSKLLGVLLGRATEIGLRARQHCDKRKRSGSNAKRRSGNTHTHTLDSSSFGEVGVYKRSRNTERGCILKSGRGAGEGAAPPPRGKRSKPPAIALR